MYPLGEGLYAYIIGSTAAACAAFAVIFNLQRIQIFPVPIPHRFLVIGAHPDDLEIACGGTLAKLADAGHEIHGLIMTNGARGGDAVRRLREAESGSKFLGMKSITFADLPDGELSSYNAGMIQEIERLIGVHNPGVLFTHSANDYHQDHNAVHLAVMRAARAHSSILCFESPSVTADFKPTIFVDVEDYRGVKMVAIGEHRDQRGKSYLGSTVIQGTGAFRGRQGRMTYAEGFEAVRLNINEGFEL